MLHNLCSLFSCTSDDNHEDAHKRGDCLFCHVSESPDKFDIVWQDDALVAFKDRNPASEHHFLVCPKNHIQSIRSLTQDDLPFLKSMQEAGTALLERHNIPPADQRMGFHIPPFNSINHLHLHVQALPYVSALRARKYPVVRPGGAWWRSGSEEDVKGKGFSWFAEVGQCVRVLEAGRRVGVLPC